jgi:hypothetical protein
MSSSFAGGCRAWAAPHHSAGRPPPDVATAAVLQLDSCGVYCPDATGREITVVTTVPQHAGDIRDGTLRAIERDLEPAFGKGWLR